MSENAEPDILLEFLKGLIEDKKEQAVLELVFQNLSDDVIIEKLIGYEL